MKTIFFVNPKAGKGKLADRLEQEIPQAASRLKMDAAVYRTRSVGDAERHARELCQSAGEEELRLIACGGDGTLNEVLNGAADCPNAAVGVMPIGTGNDFCRNFPEAGDFLSVEAQLLGRPIPCDAIRYSGLLDGREQTRYCANMFNIGFDCNVVDMPATLKKYPLIGGSLAYLLAVLVILIKKKGADLTVELDGETCQDGKLLLCALANGSFCGGGLKSAPTATVHDGVMDVNIVYNVSRLNFLHKFPHYANGTIHQVRNIEKVLLSRQCRRVAVTPRNGTMRLCADGEIVNAGKITFEAVPNAFRFVIPSIP